MKHILSCNSDELMRKICTSTTMQLTLSTDCDNANCITNEACSWNSDRDLLFHLESCYTTPWSKIILTRQIQSQVFSVQVRNYIKCRNTYAPHRH